MKAIQIVATGSTEVLAVVDVPIPVPRSGEALVQIDSSGVNFIDIYYREGRYPAPLPLVLGQEEAGAIVQIGPGKPGFKRGDRVVWRGGFGSYAEFAVVPMERLLAVPKGITLEEAAASITQGLTAHYLTHSAYPIQPDDTVLIHAGAGGTGLLTIQMAKALGARVLTTVSTEAKAMLALDAGADEVILYTKENFPDRVRELTAGAGLPVIYDSVGKSTFEQSLACLSRRGLLVLFGAASGPVPPFDLIRLSTMGSLYVTRPILSDYVATRVDLERRATDLFRAILQKRLKLRIEKIFPLAEASQAHTMLESRKTAGKLLLKP